MEIKTFISKNEIDQLTTELAERITRDYLELLGKDEELTVIVTLKGAMFFAADLIRKIPLATKIDFVRLTSYGSGTKSSGTVRILKDVESSPEGQHILVLDEIIDSGRTLHFLFDRLRSQKPKSLKLCALLSKPSRREIDVEVHYLGREVEDRFLVGYGLDYAEKYRSLPEIFYVPN